MKKICGKIVQPHKKKIFNGCIYIENKTIIKIESVDEEFDNYIIPGFIDSHVHIESSMLTPEKFGELAVKNGTVAVVADPHEIANVLGKEGVEFMINSSKKTPLKIFFMAPSCVPATDFETSGSKLTFKDIEFLYNKYKEEIIGLAEVMNYPGVLNNDKEIIEKINISKRYNKKIDGHAPNLRSDNLKKYISYNIDTDHECSTIDEALEKINYGMKIQIREGSAAKDFESLHYLIEMFPNKIMFCTDDSHPNDLINIGHINKIVKQSKKYNHNIFNILNASSVNAINHYKIPVGYLEVKQPADFIIVNNLDEFDILQTYIDGELVYDKNANFQVNKALIQHNINKFYAKKIKPEDLIINCNNNSPLTLNVIEAFDGSLITKKIVEKLDCSNNQVKSSTNKDILKIVVYNRYDENSKPTIGFIKGFKIKEGAIASTVAHDSHNIIAVGSADEYILKAINKIVEMKGGLVAVSNTKIEYLKLEIAGLMTNLDGSLVSDKYLKIDNLAKEIGCKFHSPFMTLSFMALLVLPELKISDKGLFDSNNFKFIKLIN